MDSEEVDSQRRQERLRRRRQRERDARARDTAEQREARLARRSERYRAQMRQESHTIIRHKWTPIEQPSALGGKQRLPKQGQSKPSFANTRFLNAIFGLIRVFAPSARGIQLYAHALLSLIHVYKFLHALRGCSRSLPRCATGNGLASLAACSGSPHNARMH